MNTEIKKNLTIYLILIAIAVSGIFYGNFLLSTYPNLRLWNFENILLMSIGIPFLFFQTKAGIPNFWQNGISARTRFLVPLLIGLGFGLFDVLIFKAILHPEPYTELPPFLQPFPYSLLLYFSGAFEVEVFYRLIPLTILLLIGQGYKKGNYFNYFFWFAAVLTALREPLEQLPDEGVLVLIYSFVTGFLMNLLQALYLKKSGFLSALSIRLGHYLVWHILLGVFVQYVEL